MGCLLTPRISLNLVPQENYLPPLGKSNVFPVHLPFHPPIYTRYIFIVCMAYLYYCVCDADAVDKPYIYMCVCHISTHHIYLVLPLMHSLCLHGLGNRQRKKN